MTYLFYIILSLMVSAEDQFPGLTNLTNYPGLAPVPGQVCGNDLQAVIRLELGRLLCLQALDPHCLYGVATGAVQKTSIIEDAVFGRKAAPIGNNPREKKENMAKTMASIFDSARFNFQRDSLSTVPAAISAKWLSVSNPSLGEDQNFYHLIKPNSRLPSDRQLAVNVNPGTIASILALTATIAGGPAIAIAAQGLSTYLDLIGSVDTGDAQAADVIADCPASPIPCRKWGQDTWPSFDINTANARFLMQYANNETKGQDEASQRKCSYLNQLVYAIHNKNAMTEKALLSTAPLKEMPRCNGRGNVSLSYSDRSATGYMERRMTYTGLKSDPKLSMDIIRSLAGGSATDITTISPKYERKGVLFVEGPEFPTQTLIGSTSNILNAAPVAAAYASACCDKGGDATACFNKFLTIAPQSNVDGSGGDGSVQ